jgi:hypothetical protein
MHLYVRFYQLNKENIQETLVNYRCQKTFHYFSAEAVQGLKGKVKLSISLHFTVLRMFSNSCFIQEQ